MPFPNTLGSCMLTLFVSLSGVLRLGQILWLHTREQPRLSSWNVAHRRSAEAQHVTNLMHPARASFGAMRSCGKASASGGYTMGAPAILAALFPCKERHAVYVRLGKCTGSTQQLRADCADCHPQELSMDAVRTSSSVICERGC